MQRSQAIWLSVVFYVLLSIFLISYFTGKPFQIKDLLASRTLGDSLVTADWTRNLVSNTCQNVSSTMRSNSSAMLTLFTTWSANDHKQYVHANTLRNWRSFLPNVRVIVFVNESEEWSACVCPECEVWSISKARSGVPVLSALFLDAMNRSNSTFYAYANCDIIFGSNLVKTVQAVKDKIDFSRTPVLVVGRRTNVNDVSGAEASAPEILEEVARSRGVLFRTDAEDYFITTRNYPWRSVPEFIVGSPGYDNWIVTFSLRQRFVVVDATISLTAIHQTTNFGNYEGFQKTFKDYNIELLKRTDRLLVQSVAAGHTICTDLVSIISPQGAVTIIGRRRNICRKIHKKWLGTNPIKTPWRK